MLQTEVAKALQVARHKVTVKVKRIGGGFGGKESTSGIVAAPAAIAAKMYASQQLQEVQVASSGSLHARAVRRYGHLWHEAPIPH